MTKRLDITVDSCGNCPYCRYEPDNDVDGGDYQYCSHGTFRRPAGQGYTYVSPRSCRIEDIYKKIDKDCPLQDYNTIDKFADGGFKDETKV